MKADGSHADASMLVDELHSIKHSPCNEQVEEVPEDQQSTQASSSSSAIPCSAEEIGMELKEPSSTSLCSTSSSAGAGEVAAPDNSQATEGPHTQRLQHECWQLREQLMQSKQAQHEIHSEMDNWSQCCLELQREREQLREQVRQAREAEEEACKALMDLQQGSRQLHHECEQLKEQLLHSRNMESECHRASEMIQLRDKDMEQEIEQLREQLSNATNAERRARAAMNGTRHGDMRLLKLREQLRDQLHTAKVAACQALQEMQERETEMQKECENLQQQVVSAKEAESRARAAADEARVRDHALQSKCQSLLEQVAAAKQAEAGAHIAFADAQDRSYELLCEHHQLIEQLAAAKEAEGGAQADLRDVQRHGDALQQECEKLRLVLNSARTDTRPALESRSSSTRCDKECISMVEQHAEAMQEPDETRLPSSGGQVQVDSEPAPSRTNSSRASLTQDDEDPPKMIHQRWTSCPNGSGPPQVSARHPLPPRDSSGPMRSPARPGAHIVSSRPRSPEIPRPVGPVARSLEGSPSRGAMRTPDHVRCPPDTMRHSPVSQSVWPAPTLSHSNSTSAASQKTIPVVVEKSVPVFVERVPPCQQKPGGMTPDQSNRDCTRRSCTPQGGSHGGGSATHCTVTPGRCQAQLLGGFSGSGASAVGAGFPQASSAASPFGKQMPRSLSPPRRACSFQFGSDILAT